MKVIVSFLLGVVGSVLVTGCGPAPRLVNYNQPLDTVYQQNPDLRPREFPEGPKPPPVPSGDALR